MKTLTFSFMLLLLFTPLLFSEDYFDGNNLQDIQIYYYQSNIQSNGIYFGMEQINSNYLDIAIGMREDNYVIGQWNYNINGNGSFGPYVQFPGTQETGEVIRSIFVNLHSASTVKDFVIGRFDGLQVHWNENGTITEIKQNFDNLGLNFAKFEPGVFDKDDDFEDILANNLSANIYYFINKKDGTLQNYQSTSLPHTVTNFRLKQLNQRTGGYIQYVPADRSDILFIDETEGPDRIYAYLNNNNNGFGTGPGFEFANFSSGYDVITNFEVADLDNDGFNDLIVICRNAGCGIPLYARAYKNGDGQSTYLNENTLIWSYMFGENIDCASTFKISIADLNKDGLNDLVIVDTRDMSNSFKIQVFINQNNVPIFSQQPDQELNINTEYIGVVPTLIEVTTSDIYGAHQQDGGGIALLVSYLNSLNAGNNHDLHVKLINAVSERKASPPPPPIVQRFLVYDPQLDEWHPYLYLNSRVERDFKHYEIWKYKEGGSLHWETNTEESNWTDVNECVDPTGRGWPDWNCYYYAKQVDYGNQVSIPSKYAYYVVDCEPVCEGCGEGDNPIQGPEITKKNNSPDDKFYITNYPNPFNPITYIKFNLPKASNVKFTIYNSIGQLIKDFGSHWYEAGTNWLEFNGINLPSGVYFYKLEAGQYTEVGKMLLLK
jgi:hypothetical protein